MGIPQKAVMTVLVLACCICTCLCICPHPSHPSAAAVGDVGLHEGALLTLIRLPPQKLCTASEAPKLGALPLGCCYSSNLLFVPFFLNILERQSLVAASENALCAG